MGLQLNIPGLQVIIDRVIIPGLNQNIDPKMLPIDTLESVFHRKVLPKVYIRHRF